MPKLHLLHSNSPSQENPFPIGNEEAVKDWLEDFADDLEWESHDFGTMMGIMAPVAQ